MLTTHISIGILAWNEEDAIAATLESLFRQSLFANLARRNLNCEILCVANGCTDRTASVAAGIFEAQRREHQAQATFTSRVLDLQERGKANAWNRFVHAHSAETAQFLFLMDGDIVIHHPDTLWNMYVALLECAEASVSVDQPLKDLAFKPHKTLFDRLSLATSRMTQTGTAQLTGQLYCIRAEVARNIFLPRDLLVEDGFIKALVCTDFLRRPSSPDRIVRAPNASHLFQAYASVRDILKNQKRQMIGQTITHVLVDNYLARLPEDAKAHLASFVQEKERADPHWLKRLIGGHIRATKHFWQLFPGALRFRFERLAKLGGAQRLRHLPAAIAGFGVTLLACRAAHGALRNGYTDYWPDTKSRGLGELISLPMNGIGARSSSSARWGMIARSWSVALLPMRFITSMRVQIWRSRLPMNRSALSFSPRDEGAGREPERGAVRKKSSPIRATRAAAGRSGGH